MTRRTPILLTLVALLLGAIGWASTTSPAYAGGPTSVLMTSPANGRASALYIANPEYERLYAAVGEGSTGDVNPPSTVNANFGQDEVRLTWLIHDMHIWRIDRVHLTRNDGIWVETVSDLTGDRDLFDRPARWHRPHDNKALTAVLSAAGLLGARAQPPDDASESTTPPATDSAPAANGTSPADRTSAAATVTAPGQPMLAIVVAGLAGLVIGALGTLLLRPRTARRPADRVTLTG